MSTELPQATTCLTFKPSDPPPRTPVLTTIPLPLPIRRNQLLVKIHHAALNPVDTQILHLSILRYLPGSTKQNIGLGKDFSGTIIAVGGEDGVGAQGWKVGDEVLGLLPGIKYLSAPGTLSDYIIFDSPSRTVDCLVRKPPELSWEKAAAIPLVSLTAFSTLEWLPAEQYFDEEYVDEHGTLATRRRSSKREVVVIGASGGVGIITVQLAKLLYNCRVTGVCSSRNADYVRNALGADEVIDYTSLPSTLAQALLERKPAKKYDLIIDCVGGTAHGIFSNFNALLHPKASFVTIVGDKTSRLMMGGPPTYLTHPAQLWRHIRGWFWGPRYGCIGLTASKTWLEKAVEMTASGEMRVDIEANLKGEGGWKGMVGEQDGISAEELWKRGFRHLDSARARGKIVIDMEGVDGN